MKTLICVRNLPYARATVHFGGLVAALKGAPVTLMTVVTAEESRAEAQALLEQARLELQVPQVNSKIRHGEPAEEIVKEARQDDYGLVVVGQQVAASLLKSLFLQRIARKVAERASICVLVVNADRPALRRVLICTGGHDLDAKVIEVGARAAAAAGARATLLHVTNPVPAMYTGLDAMEERLEELLQTDTPLAEHLRQGSRLLAEQQVPAELRLRHGVPTDEILREAREGAYDLLVIGPGPEDNLFRRLVMDDLTPAIVEHAPCPVLIVRGDCL